MARRASSWAIPLVVVLVILALWQLLVVVLGLKPYFIPSPLKVASTFKENFRYIADNCVPTVAQAATGFAIGNGLAVLMSIWFVHVRTAARRALYPLAIILQSIPLVALAPVFLVTLGNGSTTKVVMTTIISFFPTLVNMMRGLASVDANMLQFCSRASIPAAGRYSRSCAGRLAPVPVRRASHHRKRQHGGRHHRRVDQQRYRPRLPDHQLDVPVQHPTALGVDRRRVPGSSFWPSVWWSWSSACSCPGASRPKSAREMRQGV